MGKGYLNSKSCFSLNCCFSSNWCFNPILFKTPLTSKDGISSSAGLSDFFEMSNENFLSDNGSVYDIQSSSNNPISRSNNNYPHGEINNRSGSSEPFPDRGIHMPSGGDSSHIGDTGNGAASFEKGGTCDESGESGISNPTKGNDLPLRKDSKDPKSTDGDEVVGDSKDPKPKENGPYDGCIRENVNGTCPHPHRMPKGTGPYPGQIPPNIAALWVQCEDCLGLNYKRFLKERNNMCEHCPYHFKMNSPQRIKFLIDPDTWDPIDEDMASPDPDPYKGGSKEEYFEVQEEPLEGGSKEEYFEVQEEPLEGDSKEEDLQVQEEPLEGDSKEEDLQVQEEPLEGDSKEEDLQVQEEPLEGDSKEEKGKSYEDRLDSYRRKTGLNEAVQTGVGQLNGIPAAFGIMEFEFMGGSMGSVVGEKIARLVEYATNQSLPLIIVCASGGARVQEGSLSLMQMAKISSALLDYDQPNNKLLYISILASPTTGGVTASFGTLADITIAEPNSYIAFAGKRVIEETLKEPIPEGSQEAEPLFEKGILDLIIPRKLLKDVLTEFFKFHDLNPLNSNSIK
uniref:Acetyl-coenzyme A carboxylase carboxyl transferase subunit beta, chloroplastic n=1 Tax=Adenocalymma marginatum TaxID=1676596 RepID=A0A2P1G976_9LAMI|nr:acetyl-CoA carboxylase carboxyltransferase beta subunit [Adenocalymma marginatum]AVM81493.1 acetyl-CoA carboxylase carboxyltransferase beta subunit [Adenocalymma marginatum]